MESMTCMACDTPVDGPLVRLRVPLPRDLRRFATDPGLIHDVTVRPCRGCGSLHFDGPEPDLVIESFDLPSLQTRRTVRSRHRQAMTLLRDLAPGQWPTVLGIGTGDGAALVPYRELGARAIAVERAPTRAAISRTYGIPTVTEWFGVDVARGLRADGTRVDLALTGTTLCRSPDPHDVLEGIRLLLGPGAAAVVVLPEVPALQDLSNPGLLHAEWRQLLTPMGLHLLAMKHGLRPVTFGPPAGNRRPFLLMHHDPASPDGSADSRVTPSSSLEEAIRLWRDRLRESLVARRVQGRRLLGVGLGVEACAVLELARLGPDLVEAITDLNPFKVGHFTAGTAIPVVDVMAVHEGPVPDLVVLTQAIRDEVWSQHAAVRARGGRVIDLPTLVATGGAAGRSAGGRDGG